MSVTLPSVHPHALADALRAVMGFAVSPDDVEWPVKSAEAVRELIELNDGKADQVIELLLAASPSPTPSKLPFKAGLERLRMASPRETDSPSEDFITQHLGKVAPAAPAETMMSPEVADPAFSEALEHARAFLLRRMPELAPPSLLGFQHWDPVSIQAPAIGAAEHMLWECQKHLEHRASNADTSRSRFRRIVDLIKGRSQHTFVYYTCYASNLAIVETKKGHSNVMVASLLTGTRLYLLVHSNQSKGSHRYEIPLDMVSKRQNEFDFGALFDSDFETAGKSVEAMRRALTGSVANSLIWE